MKLKSSLLWGTALGILALVLLLGAADTARAGTFSPLLDVTIEESGAGAHSDYTVTLDLPQGDVQFAGLVTFIPPEWGVTLDDDIPIGAIIGKLRAEATLGLINGACNNGLPVEFIMLYSSVDISNTVDFEDTDISGKGDVFEDKDGNGLPDGIDKYPAFISRALEELSGEVPQPIRRAAGITIVAGIDVLLQFLIFEPGTFLSEELPSGEEFGFPTITLLQNIGDPEADPQPGAITDFCTPLSTTNTTFGVTKDNPCTDDVPLDELDPLCAVTGAISDIADEGGTVPDESGVALFTNPPEGTYTFTTVGVGQRDADGDSYENSLDTCPLDINLGNPRIGGDGDEDNDGLDAACDPNDAETNSDQDLDGYLNRQDNCPLDANGEDEDNQSDGDVDQIGDACDPNPDDADAQGVLLFAETLHDVTIGPGEPSSGETPDNGEPADGGTPSEDDDGGGAIIFIIIGVIAAVVVVGGGAFYFMRRGSGGA